MKGISFFIIVNLVSILAKAASAAEHHGNENEIPRVVLYQAINVIIIFAVGAYYGRQKIVEFFGTKKTQFLQAQEKAQSILRIAEQEHHEVKTRLDKLKLTKNESISKAKTDANDMRTQMLQEAQARALKIKEEAQMSAKIEIERAKFNLKQQAVKEAFELSKRDLSSKATSDDQKKLQDDFISKVQVVQ